MGLDEVGHRLEPRLERFDFPGLDKPQVPLGQSNAIVSRQRADDRDPDRLDRLDCKPAVTFAADAIDDDAGQAQALVVEAHALDHGGGRLRLAGNIEDEQDRHAERGGDIGRGAASTWWRRYAVEQPHRGFAERQRPSGRGLGRERLQKFRPHRPGIEIDAFAAGRDGVKRRINVIGTGFQTDDRDAPPPERPEETERQSRLAAARTGRGDHEPASHGDARPVPLSARRHGRSAILSAWLVPAIPAVPRGEEAKGCCRVAQASEFPDRPAER